MRLLFLVRIVRVGREEVRLAVDVLHCNLNAVKVLRLSRSSWEGSC